MPPTWTLDVSTFLVLLSENEETSFRRANKRLLDVLSLAPVSGLQAYLRSYDGLIDVQDRDYLSPYGKKTAPLRNIRVAQMMSRCSLLEDGLVRVYGISNTAQLDARKRRLVAACCFIAALSWLSFALLVSVAFCVHASTWVGKSNLLALAVWSVYLRILDAMSFIPSKATPSFPDKADAAIFLGRRNSALILEGSRKDILQWTGLGLSLRTTIAHRWHGPLKGLQTFARVGTFILLAFMFSTIPNGSVEDQAILVAYNVLGQLNTWLGLYIHAHRTLLDLETISQVRVATRTHVYATLLRRYRDEDWIGLEILPRTPAWDRWRRQVVRDPVIDAKELWEQCSESDLERCKRNPCTG
ncbi:hypothetical protein F4808DRAFT_354126 [Astrocystis sublimbata]|nr:hypothetical protein F4808DRAFT_354126 [Astrocystis sublimbata]